MYRMKIFFFWILALFALAFAVLPWVEGACQAPVNGVTQNVLTNNSPGGIYWICNGTYYINTSGGSGSGVFYLNASNLHVKCNGTKIIGNTTGYAFIYGGGTYKNNVTIEGCYADNYSYNFWFTRLNNSVIKNNIGNRSYMENGYVTRFENLQFYNNTLENAYGLEGYSHCLYISQGTSNQTRNGEFYNNTLKNCAGSALYVNANIYGWVNNLSIHDNKIINGSFGFNDFGTRNSVVYNNNFSNSAQYGMRIGHDSSSNLYSPVNTTYYGNYFSNNPSGDIILDDARGSNNLIANSTFGDTINNLVVYKNNTEVIFYQNGTSNLKVHYYSAGFASFLEANVTFNYSGLKEFTVRNQTVYIQNQLAKYPFNDVYNVSTGSVLASNIDNYSITLSASQQVKVGDFSSCQSQNNTAWTIQMSENCTINTNYNGKSQNITLVGSGNLYINASLNATRMNGFTTGANIWMLSSGYLPAHLFGG